MSIALSAVIVVSTGFALVGGLRFTPHPIRAGRAWRHPGLWLLVTTLAVALNQVLFTIYMIRIHGGDATFIARYLPEGWFALADHDPLLRWLAAGFPAPELLAPTLLRTQAFLELPFVLLAYLLVGRWCGPVVHARLTRLTWAAAVACTATFCLVEAALPNPYTGQDIVVRLVACLVVTPLLRLLAGPRDGDDRSAVGLLAFVLSAAALGVLVLVVYDTGLLYNLGHAADAAPATLLAVLLLAAARQLAHAPVAVRAPGPRVAAAGAAMRWFVVLFFPPALAIRYGLTTGLAPLAAVAGLLLVVAALVRGAGREWVGLAAAGVLGAAAAAGAYAVTSGYPDSRLLAAAAAFLAVGLGACAALDAVARRRS